MAVVLLLASVAHTDGRREGSAEPKVKDDGTFLRYRLAVEARGMLNVVARQRMVTLEPGPDFGLVDRKETMKEASTELLFGDHKELRGRAEKLVGKTVTVTGAAEMVLVHRVNLNRGVAQAPAYTWEVDSRITVTELKATE